MNNPFILSINYIVLRNYIEPGKKREKKFSNLWRVFRFLTFLKMSEMRFPKRECRKKTRFLSCDHYALIPVFQ